MLKHVGSICFAPASRKNPGGSVDLVRIHHGEDGRENVWAVRKNGCCLNKKYKGFEYEPSPSNREEDFFKNCRFSSPSEALDCFRLWLKEKSEQEQMGAYYLENFNYDELKLAIKKLESL